MTSLAQYDRARAALAEATRIDEVLPLRAQMDHIKLHAKHVQDRELMADATDIQIRAESKLGLLLAEAKKAGLLKASRPKKPDPEKPADLEGFTLKEIGVTEKLSASAQKKASLSEQALALMIQGVRDRIISGRAKIIEGETINGARAIMGSRQEPLDGLDYFPTPPWATRALVQHVMPRFGVQASFHAQSAWEPACGEGHIADVLTEYFCDVFASDIHDYGYGVVSDFLAAPPFGYSPDWIITNPPFGEKAEQFVIKAIERAKVGVAMFLRLQWLETIGRYENIFQPFPPAVIAQFAERVPLCKGRWDPTGSTATAYLWIVWLKARTGATEFFWIPPGCRDGLSRPDDVERFTANPVTKRVAPVDGAGIAIENVDPKTGEILNDVNLDAEPESLDIPAFLDGRAKAEARP